MFDAVYCQLQSADIMAVAVIGMNFAFVRVCPAA
ncbi:hypothetical protein AEYBE204_09915 [Asticcacaulis sp. YBE204]|nr:hypothetical protein AEYBE204_09915 [Asticcacaulis sp. YBE204]